MMTPAVLEMILLLAAAGVALFAFLRGQRRIRALELELCAARTQRQNDEQALHDRSAMDSLKDEFVSTVSHELRTPLTSIRGALGLLSAGLMGTVDPKAQNLLRIALTNTDRLIRLINDILDLQRMESGRATLQLRRCSLTELLDQAVDTMTAMAEGAGVRLRVRSLSEQLQTQVYFDGDPDRMLQVLTNLLSNAIKFSPPETEVLVEIEMPQDELVFRVVDQGRGIPENQLEAVFERFKQVETGDSRQRGGTGLGLTICRTIIQQHGGTIWAERNPERGVSICVKLPRRQRSSDLTLVPPVPPMEGTVLICHDDAELRATIAEQLRGRGHVVLEACSSEEAVALVAERAEMSPVQAILLDINMSDMDGWETLKRLTRSPETADIPLVLLSVLPPSEGADATKRKAGIEKPFYGGRLFAELGLALNRGTGSARVLLVEDDEDLASVVLAGFEKTEVRAEHASTAEQAKLLCQKYRPDLMILDLRLPDGDGFSLVDWLRSQPELKALPLVVYSGREVSPEEREKLRLGPTKFLTKARVQTHDVEDLVLAMVHRRRLRRADDFKLLVPDPAEPREEFDSPNGSHS
jgi:signal transduction histidine kinase/CheY-like chemotaxis protein